MSEEEQFDILFATLTQREKLIALGGFVERIIALEDAAKLVFSNPIEAMKRSGEIRIDLPHLKNAVMMAAAQNIWASMPREKDLVQRFFDRLDRYLPGAEKIPIEVQSEHKPDGFVRYQGIEMPVEVKPKKFGPKALTQLQRYLKEYGMSHGIAVAPELSCALPDNVTFVTVRMMDYAG